MIIKSIVMLILMEILTVSFIVIPSRLSSLSFYSTILILLAGTCYEFVQKTSRYRYLFCFYPGLFVLSLVLVYQLPLGSLNVIYLFSIVEINDSIAYVSGKFFGKRKIIPKLSPNKTYVGFFSGVVCSLLFNLWFGYYLFQFPMNYPLIIVIIATLMGGIAGDLLTSFIKRNANIKDFSNLIPTQGGILDAYDAFIFAAPFYYGFMRLILV